jgi:GT2 family glycosyltransferase
MTWTDQPGFDTQPNRVILSEMAEHAPQIDGKFLRLGNKRFLVKGVTYGTFAPDESGHQFPDVAQIRVDFGHMAAVGLNTVRVYTPPTIAVMDEAAAAGLKIIVGLPWAQHVTFLQGRTQARAIRRDAAEAVKRLGAHPAALCFALGNEIPPSVVRWHGAARVEQFLRELYDEAKCSSPKSLLTYANFPPTEYLDTECFDLCAFNVYLHREAHLRAYLARLQHIAGNKPLLLAEAGADSICEGEDGQARIVASHIRAAFAEGFCGAVAYAWTDQWWRGGEAVTDWAFGLVDRHRTPKPALASVQDAFADAPFSESVKATWPRVSVVVCAYNAAETINDCLRSLAELNYPDFEVIVVNDGSDDATSAISKGHAELWPALAVVDIPNGGLSAARNIGLAAATGEIVAYTDADVRVDQDWLTYLVQPMIGTSLAGSGGPNVVPTDDPWVAQAVARAPGGPTHVLFDDRIAEHVPGCNMAFRREALLAIDGFNPVYRRAGDDVDICWRLQGRGLRIGFSPSAVVWHHHRTSVKAYWQQQVGYGEGEMWLAAHHPEKFVNGQMLWHGHIYSALPVVRSLTSRSVNTGVWGTAAFPSVYSTAANSLQFFPRSPVWMLASTLALIGGIAGSIDGSVVAWISLAAGLSGWATTLGRCVHLALKSDLAGLDPLEGLTLGDTRRRYRALIAWLHIIQPLARLRGQIRGMMLSPQVTSPHVTRLPWNMPVPTWRDAWGAAGLFRGHQTECAFWSDSWIAQTTVLTELVGVLRASRPTQLMLVDDGWHSNHDLGLTIGRWGWLRVRTLVEEHENGRCLLRVSTELRPSFVGLIRALMFVVLLVVVGRTAIALSLPGTVSVFASIVIAIGVLVARATWQTARTAAVFVRALGRVTQNARMVPIDTPAAPGT